ncbi:MAG: FAD-dependent oxidoreductase [Sphingobium sp.]
MRSHEKSEMDRRKMLATAGLAIAGVTTASCRKADKGSVASPDIETDVVIVGSGAAGSVAALFARQAGARVLLIEKSSHYGGTSSKSGGGYWIPNHFLLREKGIADPKPDFLKYLVRVAYPASYNPVDSTLGAPEARYRLFETFYDKSGQMVDELHRSGALKSREYAPLPDYYSHLPEDKVPYGRLLSAIPSSSDGSSGGDEMMSQLHRAVRSAGIDIRMKTAAKELIQDDSGRVVGLKTSGADDKTMTIAARRGVVFASGGFAHNPELLDRFHGKPVFGACALPDSTGDFISIATKAGAKLGNTSSAWRGQVVLDEGMLYSAVPSDVWFVPFDSMFFVNKYGERCVNEHRSYHERSLAQYRWNPNRAEYPDLLNFMIYDQRTAEIQAGTMPIPPTPDGADYVITGQTLEELAGNIGKRLDTLKTGVSGLSLAPEFTSNLKKSFTRFNAFARAGKDEDFHRGETDLEQFVNSSPLPTGKWSNEKKNAALYPLQNTGPYYCIILAPGLLDTNGGPEIDTAARILGWDDQPIPGLYGAGNCIASPANNCYWAGGATLALAMTFGMIAGKNVASNDVAANR